MAAKLVVLLCAVAAARAAPYSILSYGQPTARVASPLFPDLATSLFVPEFYGYGGAALSTTNPTGYPTAQVYSGLQASTFAILPGPNAYAGYGPTLKSTAIVKSVPYPAVPANQLSYVPVNPLPLKYGW